MTADAYKKYKAHRTGSRGEIGATVSKRFGYAAVVSVLPGSPAEKAGIEATDIFESIEGLSTRDMSLREIHNLLAGTPGSSVNVSVVSDRRAEPQKDGIWRVVVRGTQRSARLMNSG